jgi:hypothetical protein
MLVVLVGDCVFRDPEITVSENSPDVKTRRLAGMMTSQGLQITSPKNVSMPDCGQLEPSDAELS